MKGFNVQQYVIGFLVLVLSACGMQQPSSLGSTSVPQSQESELRLVNPTNLTLSSNVINAPTTVNLTATVGTTSGVTKIAFYSGSIKIGEDSTAPYVLSLALTATNNGVKKFTAQAINSTGGNISTSSIQQLVVSINDTTPPNVAFATSSSTVLNAGNFALNVNASDNIAVRKVEFYSGSIKIGEDSTAPYSLNLGLTSANNGTKNFSAKAIDYSNNFKTANLTVVINIPASGITPTARETDMFNAINVARATSRFCGTVYYPTVPALRYNAALNRAARLHSQDMYTRNYTSHWGSDGSYFDQRISNQGYLWSRAAENLAQFYPSDPVSIVIAKWLESNEHCKVIMDPQYVDVGVGEVSGFWTADFGAPL